MPKQTYVAAKDIKNEDGTIAVKKGEPVIEIADTLTADRALAGLRNGSVVPEKDFKREEKKAAEPAADDKKKPALKA